MAGRIRSIKPELLEDAVTAGLSDSAFRVFIGMILIADDYGNLRAEPRYLEGQIYWSAVPEKSIAESCKEDGIRKLVTFYYVRGQVYAHINNWAKHQKVQHPGKPRVPAASEDDSGIAPKSSGEVHEPFAPDLRPPINDHPYTPDGESGVFEREELAEAPDEPDDVRQVFDHWVKVLSGLKFKRTPDLTPERRRLIASRLKEFSADDLCKAIDGVRKSPYHCGQNETGEVYVDLPSIFRNRTKVEGHLARADGAPGARASPEVASARQTSLVQADEYRRFAKR